MEDTTERRKSFGRRQEDACRSYLITGYLLAAISGFLVGVLLGRCL